MSNENTKLWDSVSKTDPNHTKKVNQRGGFTAIDAHYQVQQATEAFGPVGIGWGYECDYRVQDGVVLCLLNFWHGDRGNTFGPIAGCADFTTKRLDTDAPKKAMTDALTKALSHLGFNADVFLGKFDDNKYIAQLTAEFTQKQKADSKSDAIATLKKAQTIDELQAAWLKLDKALKADDDVILQKEESKQAFQGAN